MKALTKIFTLLLLSSGCSNAMAHGLSVYGVDELAITNEECQNRARSFFVGVGIDAENIKTYKRSVVAKQEEFESYIVCRVDKEMVYMTVSAPADQQGVKYVSAFFNAFKK